MPAVMITGRMAVRGCVKLKKLCSAMVPGASLTVFTTMQLFMPWQPWAPWASAICATSMRPVWEHVAMLTPAPVAINSTERMITENMPNTLFMPAKLQKKYSPKLPVHLINAKHHNIVTSRQKIINGSLHC